MIQACRIICKMVLKKKKLLFYILRPPMQESIFEIIKTLSNMLSDDENIVIT